MMPHIVEALKFCSFLQVYPPGGISDKQDKQGSGLKVTEEGPD